jgi:hypothetical protein
MTPEMVLQLRSRDIRCVWGPSKSTVFSAPLDHEPFAGVKNALVSAIEDRVNVDPSFRGKLTSKITEILPSIIDKALTPDVIRASWKGTGMYPWDPKLIRANMQKAVGDRKVSRVGMTKSNRDLISAVEGLLTPLPSDESIRKRNIRVKVDTVFTMEGLLAQHGRDKAAATLVEEERATKREHKRLKRAKALEEAEDRGRARVSKMVAKGGAMGQQWQDDVWKDRNTCRACRVVYKAQKGWESVECEVHWYCSACISKARWKLKAHEETCEECISLLKTAKK